MRFGFGGLALGPIGDFNQLPEEAVGLPSGFIQAGMPSVIGTLWSVNDLSTALLMIRFYENQLMIRQSPPAALRDAQLRLREVTNAELAELFDFYRQNAPDKSRTRMGLQLAQERFREHTVARPDEKAFAQPYYWASFVFYGA